MVSAQLGDPKERTALTNCRLSTAAITCDALAAPDSVISNKHGLTSRSLARLRHRRLRLSKLGGVVRDVVAPHCVEHPSEATRERHYGDPLAAAHRDLERPGAEHGGIRGLRSQD